MRTLLHRALWQRLPKTARRAALEWLAALAAPGPERVPCAGRSVVIAGVLQAPSGLGQSARLCETALAALGETVSTADLSRRFMASHPGCSASSATRPPVGPGVIVVHVNAPLMALAMFGLGRRVLKDKVVVGYWAWELPSVPASWRRGIRFVHEIWVPSTFVADAVRPIAEGRPIRVVPHPVAIEAPALASTRSEAGTAQFTVLVLFNMASGFTRKNPIGAVTAFRRAFGDDPSVRLLIKVINLDIHPPSRQALLDATAGAANIVVDGRTLERTKLLELFAKADVVLSLHRAEGFGLVLAEAMLAGLPVVATNWSGNVDFLNAENGWPIRASLTPARDPQGEYDHAAFDWADPDLDEAAAALRSLRQDPDLRQQLGRQARSDALRLFSVARYGEALAQCRARHG